MKPVEQYCFESFIVGNSNRLAYEAAKAFAEGKAFFNPLFLCGGSGFGKTHLLISMGIAFRSSCPEAGIHFIRGEKLASEIVSGLNSRESGEQLQQAQNADLLLVDDIDSFFNKPATTETLVRIFRECIEKGHRIAST